MSFQSPLWLIALVVVPALAALYVLRERFAEAAAAERAEVARELGALGVGHVVLSTSGDWLRGLAQYLSRHGARR